MNTYDIIWSENTPDGYRVFQKEVETKDEITAVRAIAVDPASVTPDRIILSICNIDTTNQTRKETPERIEK